MTLKELEEKIQVLDVPNVSQLGTGADANANDCGAGAVGSIYKAYFPNSTKTTDEIYKICYPEGKNDPLWIYMIRNGLKTLGIPSESGRLSSVDKLFARLYSKCPVIALIHYGDLVKAHKTQFSNFTGAHYVVITGMDIGNVYINDPYTTGNNGLMVKIPLSLFLKSWENSILDGNISYQAVWPTVGIGDLVVTDGSCGYRLKSTIPYGITIRSSYSVTSLSLGVLTRSREPIYITGDPMNGYIKLRDFTGWVWYEFLEPLC